MINISTLLPKGGEEGRGGEGAGGPDRGSANIIYISLDSDFGCSRNRVNGAAQGCTVTGTKNITS